jgi:hypothetical protein
MKTYINRFAILLLTAVVAVSFGATPAVYAQRDAGAKARGDFSPFWSPKSSSRGAMRTQGFAEPRRSFSLEPRQSFSYEPAPFQVGDRVVSTDQTHVMKGRERLAVIDQGRELEVRKIEGPWVGVEFEADGKRVSGWIWHQHLRLADESAASDRSAATPRVERRSFSLEPAEPAPRAERRFAPRQRDRWSYPKTDPRRYR